MPLIVILAVGSEAESADATGQVLAALSAVLKFIFSWIVLTPISVIVSGKLLAQRLRLGSVSRQLFRISLSRVLVVEATNAEVILGFTGFIITLCSVGLIGGSQAYGYFRSNFGVDPGHFTSLCVLSAFLLVVWSAAVFAAGALSWVRDPRSRRLQKRHADLLQQYADKRDDPKVDESGHGDEGGDL